MLYLFGIVPAGQPAPNGVSMLPLSETLAVAAAQLEAKPEATPEQIRRHHRVLLALLKQGSVLPFRFGAVVNDVRDLASKSEEFAAKLEHVEGCVEMTLQLPLAPREPVTSGRAYLLQKKQRLDAVDALKGEAVRDTRHRIQGDTLRVACLVPKEHVAELKAMGASGPWAPSSFV